MRPSKSRSRSKGNRSRSSSVGNIVNRVFDSSGPEGKVRGTPQQIIDKYNQLTRDATLSNDRVAAENFQQHAEYYTRMLGDAQREQEARREQQEAQNRDRDRSRGNDQRQNERQDRPNDRNGERQADHQARPEGGQTAVAPQAVADTGSAHEAPQPVINDLASQPQPDVIDLAAPETDSGLVETPESAPKPKRPRTRKPKAPKAEETAPKAPKAASSEAGPSEAGPSDAAPSDAAARPEEGSSEAVE